MVPATHLVAFLDCDSIITDVKVIDGRAYLPTCFRQDGNTITIIIGQLGTGLLGDFQCILYRLVVIGTHLYYNRTFRVVAIIGDFVNFTSLDNCSNRILFTDHRGIKVKFQLSFKVFVEK